MADVFERRRVDREAEVQTFLFGCCKVCSPDWQEARGAAPSTSQLVGAEVGKSRLHRRRQARVEDSFGRRRIMCVHSRMSFDRDENCAGVTSKSVAEMKRDSLELCVVYFCFIYSDIEMAQMQKIRTAIVTPAWIFAFCFLRFAFCVLHFAFCVLRFAFCVLRFVFCVLR